jgi:hypothetical protein
MSEEKEFPAMKPLNQLLPLDALFLYCAANMGEFTVNKANKTITFNSTYTYDENAIPEWSTFLDQAKSDYTSALDPGTEIPANDDQLFMNIEEMIDIATVLVEE